MTDEKIQAATDEEIAEMKEAHFKTHGCPKDWCGWEAYFGPFESRIAADREDLATLRARIAAVEKLHAKEDTDQHGRCRCGRAWPCPTVRALKGEA